MGTALLLQVFWWLLFLGRLTSYSVFINGFFQVVSILILLYLIRKDENSSYKIAWIIVVMGFPLFGGVLYLMIGNKKPSKRLAVRMALVKEEMGQTMSQNEWVLHEIEAQDPSVAGNVRYIGAYGPYPVWKNTKITYYPLGEDMFAAMLEDLKKAEHYIFLEYFIIQEGLMWDSILEILEQKVKEGVDVRLIYDDVGCISTLPPKYYRVLQAKGIRCAAFNPFRPIISVVMNNRDHRKILVVDGRVAFTGGINLADEYINEKERFGYWKDNAIMIRGDAVRSLTLLFLQMWNVTETGKEDYERYLVPQERELHRELGFITPYGDSPFDKENVGAEVYCHILNHAKKYVHVMTPYLIIDNQMVDTLTRAAKSGIDVKIIMPGIPDKWYAFAVAKTYYRDLISAGVKIYEFTPGFVHSKVFVSDDDTATVGTVNLDYRSLYLHFECGLFFYNNPVVRSVEKDFQETLRQCTSISVSDIKKISPFMMLCGRVLRLVAPLM